MQFPYTSCNELILSYQKHDDGKGWTLTCIMATGKTILGCFKRYLAALQFSEEQLQQMKDLVAGGKKISIDMSLDEFTMSVTHRFMDEPQNFLLIQARN